MKMCLPRAFYAVLGVVTMLFVGLIYAWSVFVRPLEAEFGWLRSQTSLTFSISMSGLCLGGLASGFGAKKLPSQIVLLCSALLIAAGFILASRLKSVIELYIFYGVFCGFGVGIGYNAVMSIVLKWFPDKLGILSGILLMGFGFGGTLLGSVAVYMMEAWGWRVTFRVLGAILAALIILASLFLKKPREDDMAAIVSRIQAKSGKGAKKTPAAADVPSSRMIRDKTFLGFFCWAVTMSAVGLAVIGNAMPMAGGITEKTALAVFVAGLVNICNGLGRLGYGFLFDAIGSKRCFFLITAGSLLSVLVLVAAFMSGSIAVLAAGFIFAGLSFGGVTPCNSAFVSKMFGQKYYAANFSIVTLQLLVSSFLGPYVAGLAQTIFGGYFGMLIILAVLCAAGAPLLFLVNRKSDEAAQSMSL